MVDECDLPLLLARKWRISQRATKGGRVYRYLQAGRSALLHRLIANAPAGLSVDHIDGDGLNNTRSNLRLCTHSQNMRNRRINIGHAHGLKGVGRRKKDGRYYAQIRCGETRRFQGGFATPQEAHLAYIELAKQLHGDYFNPGSPTKA